MTNTSDESTSPVRRITIDERLADELMRILIADLKNSVKSFNDDPEHWEEEKERLVRSEDYREKMGILPANIEEWPWTDLHEGQVFLQGRFREHPDKPAEGEFVVDMEMEQENFQRIDYFSKGRVKKVYMSALERSIPNAKPNREG